MSAVAQINPGEPATWLSAFALVRRNGTRRFMRTRPIVNTATGPSCSTLRARGQIFVQPRPRTPRAQRLQPHVPAVREGAGEFGLGEEAIEAGVVVPHRDERDAIDVGLREQRSSEPRREREVRVAQTRSGEARLPLRQGGQRVAGTEVGNVDRCEHDASRWRPARGMPVAVADESYRVGAAPIASEIESRYGAVPSDTRRVRRRT